MENRWSKAQTWVPLGYLALVLGLQIWVEVVSRTGDIGFGGIWPMLATAPVSLLLLVPLGPGMPPAPDPALDPTTNDPAYYGSVPPRPEPPREFLSESDPRPADWVPDTSVAAQPDFWVGFGFYAAILIGALVNAALLWMVLRALARRRRRPSAGTYGGPLPA